MTGETHGHTPDPLEVGDRVWLMLPPVYRPRRGWAEVPHFGTVTALDDGVRIALDQPARAPDCHAIRREVHRIDPDDTTASAELAAYVAANPHLRERFEAMARDTATRKLARDDFGRFEDLLRRLVAVPKSAVQEDGAS